MYYHVKDKIAKKKCFIAFEHSIYKLGRTLTHFSAEPEHIILLHFQEILPGLFLGPYSAAMKSKVKSPQHELQATPNDNKVPWLMSFPPFVFI